MQINSQPVQAVYIVLLSLLVLVDPRQEENMSAGTWIFLLFRWLKTITTGVLTLSAHHVRYYVYDIYSISKLCCGEGL